MVSSTLNSSLLALALFQAAQTSVEAFAPTTGVRATVCTHPLSILMAATEQESKSEDSSFVPLENAPEDDATFAKVEKFGRGSAKAKRGKRKGDPVASTGAVVTPEKSALAAEEVFYEGPPAITETIAPTISILTVVGIIPALAAWSRQAWVRYRITNRRIRVTSGIGGKDMAEIVYADIVELRTARRLFGDGDMVAFLRDGAKFEMRNIPNFNETIEFVLQQVSKEVADTYRNKGEVTRQ